MERAGFSDLVGARSADVDLRDRDAAFGYLHESKPDVVVLAAARVGGIMANDTYPADFLSENLRIQVNLMDAARELGVYRLLFLGSSCIYPKFAEQPIKESSFLTGALEPTNEAYAIAKVSGVLQVQAVRKQYGLRWISAMPTNLYGPGDNFSLTDSHVIPALIRRLHEARESGLDCVELWGTGTPRREFLHVDDLASACVTLLDKYDCPQVINIGTGKDLTIKNLAELIANIVNYTGCIKWDHFKPDGMPRKLLDTTRIQKIGWVPLISLRDGMHQTYEWYKKHSQGRLG